MSPIVIPVPTPGEINSLIQYHQSEAKRHVDRHDTKRVNEHLQRVMMLRDLLRELIDGEC